MQLEKILFDERLGREKSCPFPIKQKRKGKVEKYDDIKNWRKGTQCKVWI